MRSCRWLPSAVSIAACALGFALSPMPVAAAAGTAGPGPAPTVLAGKVPVNGAATSRATIGRCPNRDALRRWSRERRLLSPSALSDRTVVYGYDAGQPLSAQVVAPVSVSRLPVVVLVHGGAWAHGSLELLAPSARVIAEAGFVTFNIEYRLATPTSAGFPSQVGDVRQALEYVREHAADMGGDASRVGLLGTSAGGNLALLASVDGAASCTSPSRVGAVVTWSAPDDLAAYGRAQEGRCTDEGASGTCPLLYRAEQEYIGCGYATCPDLWDRASVPEHVTALAPPTLVYNSSDELVPMSQPLALVAALADHGVPNQLVVLPGHLHAIAYAAQALPGTVRFFRRYLG